MVLCGQSTQAKVLKKIKNSCNPSVAEVTIRHDLPPFVCQSRFILGAHWDIKILVAYWSVWAMCGQIDILEIVTINSSRTTNVSY